MFSGEFGNSGFYYYKQLLFILFPIWVPSRIKLFLKETLLLTSGVVLHFNLVIFSHYMFGGVRYNSVWVVGYIDFLHYYNSVCSFSTQPSWVMCVKVDTCNLSAREVLEDSITALLGADRRSVFYYRVLKERKNW